MELPLAVPTGNRQNFECNHIAAKLDTTVPEGLENS